VRVQIIDAGGSIFEEGDAEQAGGLWWEYTTTSSFGGDPATATVKTIAHDLPGNTHLLTWQNIIGLPVHCIPIFAIQVI